MKGNWAGRSTIWLQPARAVFWKIVIKEFSAQDVIFLAVSSPDEGPNSVCWLICSLVNTEFGTEAQFGRTLVPHKAWFPGESKSETGIQKSPGTQFFAMDASVPKIRKKKDDSQEILWS